MTYTDLTPICQITPAVSSGDINAQASSILKVLSGEEATFNIASGGVTLPMSGYSHIQYSLPYRSLSQTSWTSKAFVNGLSITSQPTAANSGWQLNPNIEYTYIEPNVVAVILLLCYFRVSGNTNYPDEHPVLAFNTSTKQFELRIGRIYSDNSVAYSAWISGSQWFLRNISSYATLGQLINKSENTSQDVIITPSSYTASSYGTSYYQAQTAQTNVYSLSNDVYYTGTFSVTSSTGVCTFSRQLSRTLYSYLL